MYALHINMLRTFLSFELITWPQRTKPASVINCYASRTFSFFRITGANNKVAHEEKRKRRMTLVDGLIDRESRYSFFNVELNDVFRVLICHNGIEKSRRSFLCDRLTRSKESKAFAERWWSREREAPNDASALVQSINHLDWDTHSERPVKIPVWPRHIHNGRDPSLDLHVPVVFLFAFTIVSAAIC